MCEQRSVEGSTRFRKHRAALCGITLHDQMAFCVKSDDHIIIKLSVHFVNIIADYWQILFGIIH